MVDKGLIAAADEYISWLFDERQDEVDNVGNPSTFEAGMEEEIESVGVAEDIWLTWTEDDDWLKEEIVDVSPISWGTETGTDAGDAGLDSDVWEWETNEEIGVGAKLPKPFAPKHTIWTR